MTSFPSVKGISLLPFPFLEFAVLALNPLLLLSLTSATLRNAALLTLVPNSQGPCCDHQ